jgi:hypothetical protein
MGKLGSSIANGDCLEMRFESLKIKNSECTLRCYFFDHTNVNAINTNVRKLNHCIKLS